MFAVHCFGDRLSSGIGIDIGIILVFWYFVIQRQLSNSVVLLFQIQGLDSVPQNVLADPNLPFRMYSPIQICLIVYCSLLPLINTNISLITEILFITSDAYDFTISWSIVQYLALGCAFLPVAGLIVDKFANRAIIVLFKSILPYYYLILDTSRFNIASHRQYTLLVPTINRLVLLRNSILIPIRLPMEWSYQYHQTLGHRKGLWLHCQFPESRIRNHAHINSPLHIPSQ